MISAKSALSIVSITTILLVTIAFTVPLEQPRGALASQPAPPATTTPGPTEVKPQDEHSAVDRPGIIGGEPALPGAWPWMAALIDPTAPNDAEGQFCGGTLIAPEWVLTAAHCVESLTSFGEPIDPSEVVVVLNRTDLSASGGERIAVSQVVMHPGYLIDIVPWLDVDDVGLLKLARPSTQTPLRLAGPADAARMVPGVNAVVIGWGITENGKFDILRQASLPLLSNEDCARAYASDMTLNRICAGLEFGGRDSCQGDSGGPLIVTDGAGGWLQAGVVSYGTGCALPDFPGVYMRVPTFKPWVDAWLTDRPLVNIWMANGESGRSPFPAAPDEPLTYTLAIINTGPLPVDDLVITNTLPAGATYLDSSGGTFDQGTVRWDAPETLEPGDMITHTVTIRASQSICNCSYGVTANSANGTISSTGYYAQRTIIDQPYLDIELSGDPYKLVNTPYTYTLTISNLGQGPNAGVANVIASDELPPGVQYLRGGQRAGNIVNWFIPALGPGEVVTRTLVVLPLVRGPILNMTYRVAADNNIRVKGVVPVEATDTGIYLPGVWR